MSLGALCAGTVLSWTSPALSHVMIPETNSTNVTVITEILEGSSPGFIITQKESAIVGSMLTIGALVAAIPTGYLADKFGRKPVILGLAAMFLLNWILISAAGNLQTVIAARFFAGIGLGGICVVAPMYIGEISEVSNRGTFGSFFQLFLASGVLFTCVAGYFTNWIGLGLVLAATPLLFGGSFLFMPESPTYLVQKNYRKQAEKSLRRLRDCNYDIAGELKEIEKNVSDSHGKSAGLGDILTNKAYLKSTISILGVLAIQQLSGINAVVFYTVTIFNEAGTGLSPFFSAIIVNSVQVVMSYISTLIIEKANRKFYLMFSSAGMMLAHVGLGVFFHLKFIDVSTNHLGFIPLASVILYMVSFAFGYGPVPWMLLGEMFAPEIKGIASGMAILANWMFAFLVTFLFPILSETYGSHVTFYIFAMIMFIGTIFVYAVVPETRGKSLQEIQDELNS